MAPVFKLASAAEHNGAVVLAFEVTNPNSVPMPFVGYTPDSFTPKTPEGTIVPILKIQTLRGKEWKDHPLGYCGTGIGPVAIPAKGKAAFAASVPVGGWTEVRVGISWYAAAGDAQARTAWSSVIEFPSKK